MALGPQQQPDPAEVGTESMCVSCQRYYRDSYSATAGGTLKGRT